MIDQIKRVRRIGSDLVHKKDELRINHGDRTDERNSRIDRTRIRHRIINSPIAAEAKPSSRSRCLRGFVHDQSIVRERRLVPVTMQRRTIGVCSGVSSDDLAVRIQDE